MGLRILAALLPMCGKQFCFAVFPYCLDFFRTLRKETIEEPRWQWNLESRCGLRLLALSDSLLSNLHDG